MTTALRPSEIPLNFLKPHYLCEGTDHFAPDACSGVHFQDDTGGYREPQELHYLEFTEHDTQWKGFYCASCTEAIEAAAKDPCSECGAEVRSLTKTGRTLKDLQDAVAQTA